MIFEIGIYHYTILSAFLFFTGVRWAVLAKGGGCYMGSRKSGNLESKNIRNETISQNQNPCRPKCRQGLS